jgi:hypothetical protein
MDGRQMTRLTEQKILSLCGDANESRALFRAIRKVIQDFEELKAQRLASNKLAVVNERLERW